MGYDINEASQQLRDQLGQDEGMSLDNLLATVKDIKTEREKKMKQDFEYQKEAYGLKAQARQAGFDIDYDEATGRIIPKNLPAPEPPRVSATRGASLTEPQLQTYMMEHGLTREKALEKLQGGMTTETTEGQPDLTGKLQKVQIDPASDAVLSGFKQSQISKAKAENTPQKAPKRLTESERTAVGYQRKVTRMINQIYNVLPKADRTLASAPRTVTSVGKFGAKMIGSKKGWQALDNAEALRDYFQQLEASIPFAKGGRTLSPTEKDILFRLLERGPNTSMETIRRNLKEFKMEYTQMGKMAAAGEPITDEETLSQLATDDISEMDVDSPEAKLKKYLDENGLD